MHISLRRVKGSQRNRPIGSAGDMQDIIFDIAVAAEDRPHVARPVELLPVVAVRKPRLQAAVLHQPDTNLEIEITGHDGPFPDIIEEHVLITFLIKRNPSGLEKAGNPIESRGDDRARRDGDEPRRDDIARNAQRTRWTGARRRHRCLR